MINKKQIKQGDRFKGPSKWCGYFLVRGLIGLVQLLPVLVAFRLGRGFGWLGFKFLKRRRLIVRKNLEIVNAWMVDRGKLLGSDLDSVGGDLLDAQVSEVFRRSGANLLSGFSLSRLRLEELEHHIEVEGFEHLKNALSQGKGAVLLLAHMGPWEALAQLPLLNSSQGIKAPFAAMYRPLNNTYLDDWVKKQREASGTHLFSRRDGFHKPVDFIRSGGILGILADQKMREGVVVPFFGCQAKTSPIPGLFVRRSQAPLLALTIETLAPARWKMRFRHIDLPEGLDYSKRVTFAEQCNQALELSLAQSVCDGFWLSRRFD